MLTGMRTIEPALSDIAVDASRVTGVPQVGQPEWRKITHVQGYIVSWERTKHTHTTLRHPNLQKSD